ncbi:hypothetical protein [Xanthomonas arboricola]|uniref:hypothetical protein n=1 Tax=Xanthomonas arboricola TaxID=56448 RepID=UPI00187BB847|nr:hypothetical protein [Xanthomonas arboricola]
MKYSILPSVLKPEELTGGNGLVEMGTSISILCGMIFGGLIAQIAGSHGPIAAATAVIVIAVTGNLVARLVPKNVLRKQMAAFRVSPCRPSSPGGCCVASLPRQNARNCSAPRTCAAERYWSSST